MEQFYVHLVHHFSGLQQTAGHIFALEGLAHHISRHGIAVYAHDAAPHISYFVSFFIFGPYLGIHSLPQIPLAGVVHIGNDHGPLTLTVQAVYNTDYGFKGLEGLVVHLGADNRSLYAAGEDTVAVFHGDEGNGLAPVHVVSAVDKHGAHHSPVGKRYVCGSFQGEDDPAVVYFIGNGAQETPYEKGPQQQHHCKGKQVGGQSRHAENAPDLFGRLQLLLATV